jgi:hypothetical protein
VDVEFHTRTWRRVLAGCSLLFYGGNLDSVFESASCSAIGPANGTITSAERADLIDVRNRQLAIAMAATAPDLPPEERTALAYRVIEAKGERIRRGEWEHSIVRQEEFPPSVTGSSSWRDFNSVTAEHQRRFGAQ